MKFTSKIRRCSIIIVVIILLILLFYTREHKIIVSEETDIFIEFNGRNIELSTDIEKELKNILNGTRISHSLSSIDTKFFMESTVSIRMHDRDLDGKVRGVLTIPLDNVSAGNFLGSKPNGRYRINKTDMQKIIDFISLIINPTDTEAS